MEIFSTFDFSHLQMEAAWLVIIYVSVILVMILDFITGVHKACKRGEATTSRGFRRTAEKASQYFLPMICLTAIDAIASVFLDYPYLTAIMGAFNIYIELRSIWENTHTTEETQKQQMCATELINFIDQHKEELKKLLNK